MKHSIPCLLLVAGLMAGCTLEEIVDFGAECPPREIEDSELSYIGSPYCTPDQLDRCDFKRADSYFKAKRCPQMYNICVENEAGNGYHCEDTRVVTECAFGEYKCGGEDGEVISCMNPANVHSCGSSGCDDPGRDCAMIDSRAQCKYDKSKEKYDCACPDEDVMCNGRCVSPDKSNINCGARGMCNSPDLASDNYQGENCEAGFTFCKDGKCTCDEGKIWCEIDGVPSCYDPTSRKSCNAHLMEDGVTCEAQACPDNYTCEHVSADVYQCQMTKCGKDEQICLVDGNKACVPVLDTSYCGSCINNCGAYPFPNAHPKSCELNVKDIPTCHFECDEGYTNCGSETSPRCVTLDSAYDCGTCGVACKDREICEGGRCVTTSCDVNECTIPKEDDTVDCVNEIERCGVDCSNCKSLHVNGICKSGRCLVSGCNDGEHPVYEGADIIRCDKNTPKVCAPKDMPAGGETKDCSAIFPGASTTGCTSDGTCYIVECPAGQHLANDRLSCVPNSVTECGATTSSQTVNCAAQIGNSSNVQCQDNGTCSVSNCSAGFHIATDGRSCVANSNSACGATNSSNTTNCNHIGNAASVTCQNNGTCAVTNCNGGYHIGGDGRSCVGNSSTSCGATNSSSTVNCSGGIQKVCSNGSCVCSADGSTVLNFDKTACVIRECGNIPGVQSGTVLTKNWYSNQNNVQRGCNPVQCVAGYKQMSQSGKNVYFSCRPPGGNAGTCNPFGYKYWAGGFCVGKENGTGVNGHNHCMDNYREYITACIYKDYCCGTRNLNMRAGSDYLCDNCWAKGQTCNMTSGTCQ
ncbi:MAG: hypothetical protein IKY83_07230 [Proteobacteria bacterium]|nr:hypothetical protein [Pseudomonadota bacterium]